MVPLRRVLCVEDDEDIQEVVRLALEIVGGLDVRLCGSGEQGLEEATDYRPDIILLDVMMPGMDGPATLLRLRDIPSLEKTPVVFMTAKVQVVEITHYKALGAADVISKPFDPMLLSGQVKEIWSAIHEQSL